MTEFIVHFSAPDRSRGAGAVGKQRAVAVIAATPKAAVGIVLARWPAAAIHAVAAENRWLRPERSQITSGIDLPGDGARYRVYAHPMRLVICNPPRPLNVERPAWAGHTAIQEATQA